MTHDYKAALSEINNSVHNESDQIYGGAILSPDGLYVVVSAETVRAIRHALLIADRVMGEHSAAMCCIPYSDDTAYETWIAMRDQLIKEVTE